MSLRCGLYAAEALDALAGAPIGVKWPNDLYVRGRKLAGVLIETRWRGSVAGVGGDRLRPQRRRSAASTPPRSRATAPRDATRSSGSCPRCAAPRIATGLLTADELTRWSARDVARGRVVESPSAGTRGWNHCARRAARAGMQTTSRPRIVPERSPSPSRSHAPDLRRRKHRDDAGTLRRRPSFVRTGGS